MKLTPSERLRRAQGIVSDLSDLKADELLAVLETAISACRPDTFSGCLLSEEEIS